MVCVDNGQVCGVCKKKINSGLVKLGEVHHIELFSGFAICDFFVGAVRKKGCNKFLLGPFVVCVVEAVGTILVVRGCARSLKNKNKKGSSCRKRRSPAMFSRLALHDI